MAARFEINTNGLGSACKGTAILEINKQTMKTEDIKTRIAPGRSHLFFLCVPKKNYIPHIFWQSVAKSETIFLGLIRNILCHALLLWHHTGHLGFTVMLIWCFTPLSTLFKSYCDIMKGSIQWSTMIHRHEQNSSSRNLESSDLMLGELTTLPPGWFEV